jgi:hypothetical protein
MPSHNLASIKIDDLEIIGYSVAGEETVVAVPQLDDQIQTHFLAQNHSFDLGNETLRARS